MKPTPPVAARPGSGHDVTAWRVSAGSRGSLRRPSSNARTGPPAPGSAFDLVEQRPERWRRIGRPATGPPARPRRHAPRAPGVWYSLHRAGSADRAAEHELGQRLGDLRSPVPVGPTSSSTACRRRVGQSALISATRSTTHSTASAGRSPPREELAQRADVDPLALVEHAQRHAGRSATVARTSAIDGRRRRSRVAASGDRSAPSSAPGVLAGERPAPGDVAIAAREESPPRTPDRCAPARTRCAPRPRRSTAHSRRDRPRRRGGLVRSSAASWSSRPVPAVPVRPRQRLLEVRHDHPRLRGRFGEVTHAPSSSPMNVCVDLGGAARTRPLRVPPAARRAEGRVVVRSRPRRPAAPAARCGGLQAAGRACRLGDRPRRAGAQRGRTMQPMGVASRPSASRGASTDEAAGRTMASLDERRGSGSRSGKCR